MTDKNKLIEAIAVEIHLGIACCDWKEAQVVANAALIALCKELPEVRHGLHRIGYEKYNALKEIGK